MAENTNICNPLQYLLEVDEQNTWVVRDIATPSSINIIILLLQKDKESRIAIYQTDQKGFQHKEYICQDVEWTDSPLLLSSIYVEDSLNTLICTEKQLISYDNEKLTIRESVPLSERPMAICVDRSNIFVSAAKANKITVFNPSFHKESEHKMTCIGMSESLTAIVVTFKNMYACTKNGKAFWYDLNKKEKKIEYRNRRTQNSKANNIALYKGKRIEYRLVLIIWSESEIHLYSSNSGHTLFAIDVNSSKKIRLTMTNQLIAAEANNAAIYDMNKIIDRGIFLSIFVSSTKPECREDFIGYVLQRPLYETSESPKRQQDKKPRRSETPVAGTFNFKREQLGELYEMYKRSLENYTEVANSMEEKDQAIDELQGQLKDRESKIVGLQKTLDEDSHQVEKTKEEIRSRNMTLENKVQEMKEKIQLLERKAEETTNMLSTIQTDLTEVKNNTSKLLQESKDQSTVAEEPKTKLKDLAESSYQRQKSKRRSGVTSSLESGIGSFPNNAEIKDAISLHNKSEEQTYRRAVSFKSSVIITKDGGRIEIKGTDVSLLVPPGALLEDCEIHIQIITGNLDKGDDVTFASNSAAIVELTPNNFEFQTAVELNLPHCLKLKENFTNESMEVFTSHHHPKASPHWERETEVKFELQEESCKLYLKKFCWITFRINNEIVEAKRLKIFTVGSKVMDTDSETTVHVGYLIDVPGYGDIFSDESITVGQYKPFWFKKEKPSPLVIFLMYLMPNEWKNTADGSRKEISYQDIASSKNKSCEFVLRCITSVRRSGVPYSTFRVYRQHDSTSISFRPKIWNDVSEDEEQ